MDNSRNNLCRDVCLRALSSVRIFVSLGRFSLLFCFVLFVVVVVVFSLGVEVLFLFHLEEREVVTAAGLYIM